MAKQLNKNMVGGLTAVAFVLITAAGVYMYRGEVVKQDVGEALGIKTSSLDELLQRDRAR